MNSYAKVGLAAAAIVVVAFAGYSLLPRTGPGPAASPTPTTSPAAIPTPSAVPTVRITPSNCDDDSSGCAGALSAGTHESTAFRPKLAFTVPDGWVNPMDIARTYTLHSNFAPANFFQLVSQVAIPAQDAACSAKQLAGAGNTVDDWVTFLTTHPGLVTTTPKPVSVGGYSGMQVDVHVASTWTKRCPDSIAPAVMLITDNGAVPTRVRWIDDQRTRFRIIDVAGETVIVYLEAGQEAGALDAVDAALKSVVDTFVFTP